MWTLYRLYEPRLYPTHHVDVVSFSIAIIQEEQKIKPVYLCLQGY